MNGAIRFPADRRTDPAARRAAGAIWPRSRHRILRHRYIPCDEVAIVRRPSTVVLLLVLALAACTGDDDAVIETASVGRGEVVQTVASPARLEPAARATVTASVTGQVEELLVDDGDEVAAGDPLVRFTSTSLED